MAVTAIRCRKLIPFDRPPDDNADKFPHPRKRPDWVGAKRKFRRLKRKRRR